LGSLPVRALGAEYFPRLAEADLRVGAGEVAAFLRECALLRENLYAIAASVDLSRQPGIAVSAATGRVTVTSDSPEVFREQVSLRLAHRSCRPPGAGGRRRTGHRVRCLAHGVFRCCS
jgi:hypothetical protein